MLDSAPRRVLFIQEHSKEKKEVLGSGPAKDTRQVQRYPPYLIPYLVPYLRPLSQIQVDLEVLSILSTVLNKY